MSLDLTLFTLLHLLMFAYWLGGDIGVFYSSFVLTDAKQTPQARMAAAKILLNVDMVPRVCLLLSLPSGLALATAKGWVGLDPLWIALAFAIAFAWIWLAFRLHVDHAAKALGAIDRAIRPVFLLGLLGTGGAALTGMIELPLFLALKLIALGVAVMMGLIVRRILKPFGAAFAKLASEGGSPETDAEIASSIGGTRKPVMVIWAMLLFAAYLGVATPT